MILSARPKDSLVALVGQIKSTTTSLSWSERSLAIAPTLRACSILSSIEKPRSELRSALIASALR